MHAVLKKLVDLVLLQEFPVAHLLSLVMAVLTLVQAPPLGTQQCTCVMKVMQGMDHV